MILSVRERRNTMHAQSGKHKTKQDVERFCGITFALMAGRERDPKLHLKRVLLSAVQPTVADHALCPSLDNSHLKPCPRNTDLPPTLVFDESGCILWPKRRPRLIPCHLRQRTVATQRVSIVTLQPAKQQATRGQCTWESLVHSGHWEFSPSRSRGQVCRV